MRNDQTNRINPGSNIQSISVSVDRVSKTYPVPFLRLKKFLRRKFKPPVEALRNVSFNIREGEIFGLIGPNGAGKTTLTKIIATLIQPTDGSATVNGHDTVRDDGRVRRNVGLASAEERSFYWRLTAEQNLLFFARLYGLSGTDAQSRIKQLFQMFEFDEQARRFNQYAGAGVASISRSLPLTLMVFLAVLLPFSLWVFNRAVRRAKREGSLIQY
jgi:ABC-type multidrug transport system ATPase subunit